MVYIGAGFIGISWEDLKMNISFPTGRQHTDMMRDQGTAPALIHISLKVEKRENLNEQLVSTVDYGR